MTGMFERVRIDLPEDAAQAERDAAFDLLLRAYLGRVRLWERDEAPHYGDLWDAAEAARRRMAEVRARGVEG